jgi:LmbE family N-acetylglucosaminyl deacetylase
MGGETENMPGFLKRVPEYLYRLFGSRYGYGPYRFIIRHWEKISDIDTAVRLLETQFFDRHLVPVPLPVEEVRTILVMAPHQDDEIIGAGGTLLLARRAGAEIHILFLTDGRPKKATSEGTMPEEVVNIRKSEAMEVCEQLEAHMHCLDIDNVKLNPSLSDLDHLARVIETTAPQVLLVPWLLDTPKHRVANHLLWLANQRRPLRQCEVWGYQVHNSLLPNGYVDITEVMEEKTRLLRYYTSQIRHVRRYDHMAKGMAAWNCRFLPNYKADPMARYVEIFCALPLREHLRLVESFYFPDLNATYRGMNVAEGMKKIHRSTMGGVL